MSLVLKQALIHALKQELPGEVAQYRMAPISRKAYDEAKKEGQHYRKSGVTVIIQRNQLQRHEIILIQRPEYEGKHGGQISFPGGKMELSDPDIFHTAIRECQEEIGILLDSSSYLGKLSPVLIPVSQFHVEPHVFYLEETLNFSPDPREVAEIFQIQLQELMDEQRAQITEIRISQQVMLKNIPYFNLENKVIWGATALILSELKELCKTLPIQAY